MKTPASGREAVADAGIRADVARAVARRLELAAQVGDVRPQDVGGVGVLRAPHLGEQRAVRHAAARGCARARAAARARSG